MSLPLQIIDRIFTRLVAAYGRRWHAMWDGVEPNAVMSLWAHELVGYATSEHRIDWALEHLPYDPPNAMQFKRLCHLAPDLGQQLLPPPKADPIVVEVEKKRQAALRAMPPATSGDRQWAYRIMANHQAGHRVRPATLKMAKEALGLPGA